MTTNENILAISIIKEHFGDLAKSIAKLLIKKSSYPFMLIANDLNLEKKLVSQLLSTLITHDLVKYKLNSRSMVEYSFSTKNTLLRLKFPRIIYTTRKLFDDISEFIVEELLLNGYLEMSDVILRVYSRLDNKHELNSIKEKFKVLAANNFVKRCPMLDDIKLNETQMKESKIPVFLKDDYNIYTVPDISVNNKTHRADNENDEIPNKIRKIDETYGDDGIFWRVNFDKYVQYFRDEIIIKAFESKIDKNASNLVRIMINTSNSPSEEILIQTKPVTLIDIQKQIRLNEERIEPHVLDKYLAVLVQDSFNCIEKVGDFGGGAYSVDIRKAIINLCKAHMESYVREKYGSRCLRIFKIVMEKVQIEQQQIEEFAMFPSKDCKNFIYTLLHDNLLTLTELSKTADHAPSRTTYLFSIDYHALVRKLLENSYKGMFNLMLKYEQEMVDNKRLIEKQQKIDTIIASLIAQQAEQAEIDDVKQTMSEIEANQMKRLTNILKKIEQCQMDLEETIFLFEYYFLFDIPFVKPTKKSS